MLDRLISGAGALTDRADRVIRVFTSGHGPDLLGNRPGSVIVIVLLIAASVVLGFLAIEASDNPTPRTLAPAEIASADDLGRRVFATIEGVLDENFVETFPDDDDDGQQDPDETGDAWFYFLVDDAGRGVTVRSTRHPDDMYRYTATGVVVRDPEYISEDVRWFGELDGTAGLELEDTYYVDAVPAPAGSPQPLDLSAVLPAVGTVVTISGPYLGYVDVCSGDADGDGLCEDGETDLIDAFIADPGSGRAITVLQAEHPQQVPIRLTGMLRNDAGAIREAKAAEGMNFDALGLNVSDRYLLVDGASPANGTLSLVVAIGAAAIAAILAVGLAGGYLVFRRSKRPLRSGARRLEAGEEIPLRVTGTLRRPEQDLIHVREAPARLVRFVLAEPAPSPGAVEPTAEIDRPPVAWEAAPASATPTWSSVVPQAAPVEPQSAYRPDVPTTLIVERDGRPEGVALGKGELRQVMSGRVMPLRGPRPALRVLAGTGVLLLSFDSKEARDRAAAELIDESGLLIRGNGIAGSTA